jgi:hypothetical protein
MSSFEIYFDDLTPEAQDRLLETFKTAPQDENWYIAPLASIEREEEVIDEPHFKDRARD